MITRLLPAVMTGAVASAVGVGLASSAAAPQVTAALVCVAALATGVRLATGAPLHQTGELADTMANATVRAVLLNAVPALVVVNALDVRGFFLTGAGGLRYLVIAPFVLAIVAIVVLHATRELSGDIAFVAFILFACAGALYGAAYVHPTSSALPLAASSVLGLAYVGVGRLSRSEIAKLRTRFEVAVYLYVAMHVAAALYLFDSGINRTVGPSSLFSNGSFTHEKSPILLMALYFGVRRGSIAILSLLAIAVAIIYIRYPAGTYAAGFLVFAALLVVLRVRSRSVGALFAAILVAGGLIVLQLSNTNSQFASGYFARVGKTNNVSTRTLLWSKAESEIRREPVFGSGFSGEATLAVAAENLPPRVAPHNDYLEILLLGGAFAIALLFAKIVSTGRLIGVSLRSLGRDEPRRILLEATAVGIAGFLVVFIFNPVLLKVSLGSLFFALLALARIVALDVAATPATETANED